VTDTAILPEWLRVAGMVAAAALAGAAVLAHQPRRRALAALAALALVPLLLVAEIWDTPQVQAVRDRPAVALAALAAALVALALGAALFARRPGALAVLAVAALPFRLPVEAGGSTANLLVPLYLVIAAGVLGRALPALRIDPEHAPDERERPPGWLERLLVAAVVLYAVQASWSSDPEKALEQVVFFYVPFMLLFALLRELDWGPRTVAAAFCVLVALALVFTGIGFVEWQLRELLLNPKVIASNQVEGYFRVNSLFFDPNIYGRFLALVMIGLAAVLLWRRRTAELVAATVALAVLWGGLLLTLSQSSFAALLAGLAVLAALRLSPWKVLVAAGAAAAVAVALVLLFPGALRVDLTSRETVDDATSGRYELVRGGVELALERPALGWGSGAFEREYRRSERTSGQRAAAASHTIPVTVAAEQGVVGLAVFLALLVAALTRLLPGARASAARAAVAAGFVALVLHTWLYAAFLEDPVTWTLLGVGTALAAGAHRGAAPDAPATAQNGNGRPPGTPARARATT